MLRAPIKILLIPSIVFYVTTTLLPEVGGASTSPSSREFVEARKTIGHYLRTEAGETALAEMAKNQSAPVTAEDLMKAILANAKEDKDVRKAAGILIEALKSQSPVATRLGPMMEQNGRWKDLIADIEMENDIICLYRKSTNETAKKADDWKKFLKTISPGYVVHLALDTGLKYVICLKKIEVPESKPLNDETSEKTSTSTESSTTEGTTPSSTTTAKSTLEDETSFEQRDDRCKDRSVLKDSHTKDEDAFLEDSVSSSSSSGMKATREEMEDSESAGTLEGIDLDDISPNDEGYYSSRRFHRSKAGKPCKTLNNQAAPHNECKRPIIFIVPNRYVIGPEISRRGFEPVPATPRVIGPRQTELPTRRLKLIVQGPIGNHYRNPSYNSVNLVRPDLKKVSTGGTKTVRGWKVEKNSFIPQQSSPFVQRRRQLGNFVNREPFNNALLRKILYEKYKRPEQPRIRYADPDVPARYRIPNTRLNMANPRSFSNARFQPQFYQNPVFANYPIATWNSPPWRQNIVVPKVTAYPNSKRTVPCKSINHMEDGQTEDESDRRRYTDIRALLRPILHTQQSPYQITPFVPPLSSRTQSPCSNNAERVNCGNCCDKTIKLEILVHGKANEQPEVGVQTEDGNKRNLGNSVDSLIPDPSTTIGEPPPDEVYTQETKGPQTDKTSSANEPPKNDSLGIDKNDPVQTETESTTADSIGVDNKAGDVEQRFLYETTTIRLNPIAHTKATMSKTSAAM